jgi:hypothetical protein
LSRQDTARLHDIVDAVDAIRRHLMRGDLDDGLVCSTVGLQVLRAPES